MSATTHIAALITAMHGKPVEVVYAPADSELRDRAISAYVAVRYPDEGEDTQGIMIAARNAVLELHGRLVSIRGDLKHERTEHAITKAALQRAWDAFDEQSEEIERLRKELGR